MNEQNNQNLSQQQLMTKLQTEMKYTREDIKKLDDNYKQLYKKLDDFITSVENTYARKTEVEEQKQNLEILNKKVDNKIYKVMVGIITILIGVVAYLLKTII